MSKISIQDFETCKFDIIVCVCVKQNLTVLELDFLNLELRVCVRVCVSSS